MEDAVSCLLSDQAIGRVTSSADVADALGIDLDLRERTTLDWYLGPGKLDPEGLLSEANA